jgi:Phage major capsid protein E
MATVRSFEKPFDMVDYTEDLMLIPNQWGLVNELGIFRNESISQHSITIEKMDGTLGLITDQVRGARNLANKDDTRQLLSFSVPHFPLVDMVSPSDIQGKRAYGQPDAAETEAAVMARKLTRIRQNHAVTMEAARCFAITNGAIYAPNGTVVGNYYTSFGVTRKEVDFVLDVGTTDVIAKGEEVIAHIQDNILSGEAVSSVTALCSPEFFAALIAQAGVKEAYKYYSSTQEPLRTRLGSGLYRRFDHGGIEYIEYRGSYNGTRLIPAGDAYFIPRGTADMFISYFSPANKFSHVGTLGEEAYAFVYRDPKDEQIEIQTEHNAIHLIRRPSAIVKATA